MTKLANFLKELPNNKLVPVDNWNMLHAQQLEDIGFKENGRWRMDLTNPRLTIVYVKDVGFVLVDMPSKTSHKFKDFEELANHLAQYKQKWKDAPYTDTGKNT